MGKTYSQSVVVAQVITSCVLTAVVTAMLTATLAWADTTERTRTEAKEKLASCLVYNETKEQIHQCFINDEDTLERQGAIDSLK